MGKYKNTIFLVLLAALFIEILIVFPNHVEHEDEAAVRARVEAQRKQSEKQADVNTPVASNTSQAEQRMAGVHLVESQSGNRDWELFAQTAEGSEGEGEWKLFNVKVLFYNKEKVEFTVTGKQGAIDSKSKNIRVSGDVVTKSENGYTFKTQEISYFSEFRRIDSPGDVVVNGPSDASGSGLQLRGADMQVLVDESRMLIRNKISAQKNMKDGKKVIIRADAAELSGKTSEASFHGKVSMDYDKMKIEGPAASFLFDKKTNFFSTISIKGGVRVSDADKFATSDSLKLDLLSDKYSFTGSPRLVQNNDELRGDEIVFIDGGKKIKVERVRAKVENKEE